MHALLHAQKHVHRDSNLALPFSAAWAKPPSPQVCVGNENLTKQTICLLFPTVVVFLKAVALFSLCVAGQ